MPSSFTDCWAIWNQEEVKKKELGLLNVNQSQPDTTDALQDLYCWLTARVVLRSSSSSSSFLQRLVHSTVSSTSKFLLKKKLVGKIQIEEKAFVCVCVLNFGKVFLKRG